MTRFKLSTLILMLLARILLSALPAQAAPAGQADEAQFWRDISIGYPLVDWFNRVARPDDIARVENISQLELLERIHVGRKLVVFKSVTEAEQIVPGIAGQIDIIGYNLEHGPANPIDEQENPLAAIKRMRQLANDYGLLLALGPDRSFALSDGVYLAPYVDIFVLQVQKVQTETATVTDFVLPLVPQLRQANPNLQVSVQIRTEGDVVALADLVDLLRPNLDGVSILTSPETISVAADLIDELNRHNPAGTAATAATAPTKTPRTDTKGEPVAEDPLPQGMMWLLIVILSLVAGAIGGGAIALHFSAHK